MSFFKRSLQLGTAEDMYFSKMFKKHCAFSHSLNINVPFSSHRVDRGVQAILGCVCHSAYRGCWTVHPRWSGLLHQKLETEPTDRSISVCHHSHIHMVYSVCIFVCCMFCVILEVSCGSFFFLFPPGSFQSRPGGFWAVEGQRRPNSWLAKQRESTNATFQSFYSKMYLVSLEYGITVLSLGNSNSNLKWRSTAPTWHKSSYSAWLRN